MTAPVSQKTDNAKVTDAIASRASAEAREAAMPASLLRPHHHNARKNALRSATSCCVNPIWNRRS